MTILIILMGIGESLVNLDPAWIALIGTLLGGLGLKMVEAWLGKGRVEVNDATQIRSELRQTIESQRTEIHDLDSQVETWRGKYYDLQDEILQLKSHMAGKGLLPEE